MQPKKTKLKKTPENIANFYEKKNRYEKKNFFGKKLYLIFSYS